MNTEAPLTEHELSEWTEKVKKTKQKKNLAGIKIDLTRD